jgi:RNA polymerase-binding transcription factor DksA
VNIKTSGRKFHSGSGDTISPMADATGTALRAVLAAERERLATELEAMGVDRGTFDEGFADSGQVTAERGEVDAIVGTLRDTLNEIDDALRKLEAGTYGLCESCGEPIPEARLEAMPSARLCIACASKRR